MQEDADIFTLEKGRFDALFCCSALIYLTNIPHVIGRWYSALKPGGRLAFTCFADTAFLVPKLLRETAAEYGMRLPNPNAPCGSRRQCEQLVSEAGFHRYEVITELMSYPQKLASTEAVWPKPYGPFVKVRLSLASLIYTG